MQAIRSLLRALNARFEARVISNPLATLTVASVVAIGLGHLEGKLLYEWYTGRNMYDEIRKFNELNARIRKRLREGKD